jgi:hypothetical protein
LLWQTSPSVLIVRGNCSNTGNAGAGAAYSHLELPNSEMGHDLEPEMIEVGRKQAAERGVSNIKWLTGVAEDFVAPAGSFELITIGEAFHRLDQALITEQILRWLKLKRCLAIIGAYGILNGNEPWQHVVAEVIGRWTGQTFSKDQSEAEGPSLSGPQHDESVLAEAGFAEVGSYRFSKPYVWTIETIVGNLYSTSFCSKRVLGAKSQGFETPSAPLL